MGSGDENGLIRELSYACPVEYIFTSSGRPGSSRPGILRSLLIIAAAEMELGQALDELVGLFSSNCRVSRITAVCP